MKDLRWYPYKKIKCHSPKDGDNMKNVPVFVRGFCINATIEDS